jgi:hypothetical protein
MYVLYDTTTVHPLDRYDHYRAGAATELAPVAVHGRSSGRLLATMSVVQVGDFEIETITWAADSEVVARRTERLIRARDPECYRILLSVDGGLRMEQAGNQVDFRARDIALYDLSHPWQSTHPMGPVSMRVVMLSFPRALVPIAHATVRPLVGTVMPRSLPGRSLIAQFLIGLTDAAITEEQAGGPGLAEVLHECTVGLIRQRLGQPDGITPGTRRLLRMARIRDIIRQHLGNPELDPDRIAQAANISPRYANAAAQADAPGGVPPQPARSGADHDAHQGRRRRARLPAPRPVCPRLQTAVRRLGETGTQACQPAAVRVLGANRGPSESYGDKGRDFDAPRRDTVVFALNRCCHVGKGDCVQ